MINSTIVQVSDSYEICLPSAARECLNIKQGDQLLLDIHDHLLILRPQPENYVMYMAGLHQEIWREVDTSKYLNQERESWNN